MGRLKWRSFAFINAHTNDFVSDRVLRRCRIMSMTEIRPLTAEDATEYYNIRLRGLTLDPEAFGSGAAAFSKTTVEQAASMIRGFNSDDFILGSFVGNQLIGVIGYLREKKHSVSHKATVWGFMVLPEFRNKGVGSQLLQSLIESASAQKGIEHIRAIITMTGSNAVELFQAKGFKQYGLELQGIRHEEKFYDQAYLALSIQK